jgi:hypothetical protein
MKKLLTVWLTVFLLIVGLGFSTSCSTFNPKKIITPQIEAFELKEGGGSAIEVAQVLEKKWNLKGIKVERVLYEVGFGEEKYLDVTAFETVRRFAPVLKFDKAHKGLPMSADVYFKRVMRPDRPNTAEQPNRINWKAEYYGPRPCDENLDLLPLPGRDDDDPARCGMSNNEFEKLRTGQVPTYFRVISDMDTLDEGRLRIAYWWFYGWQPPCNDGPGAVGDDGAHNGDWEHILVTTSPDRLKVDFVTYYFHDAHYTRKNFELEVDRPVVYVGKLGHGSYHSNEGPSCWMLESPHHCCEYADCRNPTKNTKWHTFNKLVSLHRNSEAWMRADRVGSEYEYNGQNFIITPWRWGPLHAFCHFWLFGGCTDWGFSQGVGTHPTVVKLNWRMSSCGDVGCGRKHCKGLLYTHNADFNQPWPSKLNRP